MLRMGTVMFALLSITGCSKQAVIETDTNCPEVQVDTGRHPITYLEGQAKALYQGKVVHMRWKNGKIEVIDPPKAAQANTSTTPTEEGVKPQFVNGEALVRVGNTYIRYEWRDDKIRQRSSLIIVK